MSALPKGVLTEGSRNQTGRRPKIAYIALFALVLALQFGPFTGLIGYRLTSSFEWTFIGLIRDVLVLLVAAIVLLQSMMTFRARKWLKSEKWAMALVVGLLVAASTSSADTTPIALNLRRVMLFPVLCLAVISSRLTSEQVHRLLRLVIASTVLVAGIGILEYLAPNVLWTDYLRVIDYFSANPLDPFGMLPFEETGRFFSWDLQYLYGGPVRRAVSTYIEPTTLAAALICAVCLLMGLRQSHGHRQSLQLLIVLVCGVLTLSKGFALAMILLVMYLYIGIPSPRRIFIWTLVAGTAGVLLNRFDLLNAGPASHVIGLSTAIDHLISGYFFGEGLGNAGNYASEGSNLEIGAESGLGNLLSQVGVVALLYIAWIQIMTNDILAKARMQRDRAGHYIAAMLMGWYVSFLFSASSLGIGGNALIFLAISLYLHPNYKPRL